jgi:hypothetical protein
MACNMDYYMNSCITSEYTDHELLEVANYIAEVLQNTALDAQAPIRLPSPPTGRHWATRTCHNTHSTRAYLQFNKSISKA